jgi:hypothetical protein
MKPFPAMNPTIATPNSAFYAFKRDGIQFILIPNGPNCSICDSDGNNYGSWTDVASFGHFAKKDGGFEKLRIGKVSVQFQCVR